MCVCICVCMLVCGRMVECVGCHEMIHYAQYCSIPDPLKTRVRNQLVQHVLKTLMVPRSLDADRLEIFPFAGSSVDK